MINDPLRQRILYTCEVKSVEDDQDGLRIKVYIDEFDRNSTIDELPYCFPLLPKHLHINPKVGESVNVLIPDIGDPGGTRYFIGPNISQAYRLHMDPHYYSAQSLLPGETRSKPKPAHNMDPENNGSVPDREDIALQGRTNTDVVLKDEEIRIRCGFKKTPLDSNVQNRLHFNKSDLAYIQMRHGQMRDEKGRRFGSVINIVADRINLLSHKSRANWNLSDPDKLIPDDEMERILSNNHPLVYGDELIAYLKRLISVIREHTHPWSQDPPCLNSTQREILSEDLDKMLSASVTTN